MARPVRQWLARAAALLIGVQLLYLAAGNLLLSGGAIERWVNRQPEKVRLHWDRAWTLWPGHFHAQRLRMAGHSRRVAWNAQVEEASGRVALLPLLWKNVRVPVVTANGVTGGASRIDVERQPATPRPGGWTLDFGAIHARNIRQANYGALVLRGAGVANFSLVKQLRGGAMQIRPSSLELHDVDAWYDGEQWLQRASLRGELAMDRHTRAEARGLDKLLKTVATLEIDGETLGLRVTKGVVGGDIGHFVRLDRTGKLQGKLQWNRGELEAGSKLRASMPVESELTGEDHEVGAAALVQVDPQQVAVQASIAPGAGSELSTAADLRIAGRAIPLHDPAALLQRTDGRLRGRWHFDSLAWLSQLMPGPRLLSFDGAGSVDADLVIEKGELQSGSRIDVPEVVATASVLDSVFNGVATATATLASGRGDEFDTRLQATMHKFSVAPADAPAAHYVDGHDLRFDATARGQPGEIKSKVQARLQFNDAVVPDLRVYNRYLPSEVVRLERGAGLLSGDLHFDGEGDVADGVLRIAGKQAVVRIGDAKLTGDLGLLTRLKRADIKARTFIVDGSTMDIANLRVQRADAVVSDDWWGKVSLPAAKLRWTKPMHVNGRATIAMRDLQPLLTLFEQKKRFPAWVGRLVDEGEISAEGRVAWGDGVLVLDDFAARNDRLEVKADLRTQQKQPQGALYARWGKLDLAAELDGAKRDLHLMRAREWYDARPPLNPR